MEQSELILSLKTKILTSELRFKKYDVAEILIKGQRLLGRKRVWLTTHRWLTENNIKGAKTSASEHVEYTDLFIEHEGLFVLQIIIEDENFEIRGNIPVEEHNIQQIEEFKNPIEYLYNRMNPHLEIGASYMTSIYKNDGLYDLSIFDKYIDNVLQEERVKGIDIFDETDPVFPLVLEQLIKTFTDGKKTQIIARKDDKFIIKECSVQDLLSDTKQFYDRIYKGDYWIKCNLQFEEISNGSSFVNIKTDNYVLENGKEKELHRFNSRTIEYLYLALNKSISKLEFEIKNGDFKIYADKAFPQYGIEKLKPKVYDISENDLEMICRFIESGVQAKMDVAVLAAKKSAKTLKRIEKRYLGFIKAQKGDEKASLSDLTEEMFSEKTKDICVNHRPIIAKDYINVGYQNKKDTKLLIDLVGSLVQNFIDVEKFMIEIDTTYKLEKEIENSLEERARIYDKYQKKLKSSLRKEAKLNENGWWSQTCKALASLKLQRVQIEKSSFYDNQQLPVLKEYMFFINSAFATRKGIFDISNSQIHDLSSMFWRFRNIPEITWFQSEPSYPKYPYDFNLDVKYSVDNKDFKELDVELLKK